MTRAQGEGPLKPETLDYDTRGGRGSREAVTWPQRVLLIVAVLMIPVSAAVSVRGLVWDYRGSRIYDQRERESATFKGFLTGEHKGYVARETSRAGWILGRRAVAVSSVGAVLVGVALLRRRLFPRAALWVAGVVGAAHVAIAAGTLLYWVLTGIPQPWRD